MPRDPVKQEALEAGGNRRGSGRWIVRTQSGQSDHEHRLQYFALCGPAIDFFNSLGGSRKSDAGRAGTSKQPLKEPLVSRSK